MVSTRSQEKRRTAAASKGKRRVTLGASESKKRRVSSKKEEAYDDDDDDYTQEAVDDSIDYKAYFEGAKGFIMHVLRQPKSNLADATGLWRNLSPEWQSDREVALVALVNNFVKACDLPLVLQQDSVLLLAAIGENPTVWCSLPYVCRNKPIFAKAIRAYNSRTLAWCVLEEVPALCDDKDVWTTIVDSKLEGLESLIKDKASESILSDSDLLQRASLMRLWKSCGSESDNESCELADTNERAAAEKRLLKAAVDNMSNYNPDVECLEDQVEILLDSTPQAVTKLTFETQRRFPAIVATTFGYFSEEGQLDKKFALKLAPEIFQDRAIGIEWFKARGGFLDGVFPESWKSDKGLFELIVTMGLDEELVEEAFRLASDSILDDKKFLAKAILCEPRVMLWGGRDARRDLTVQLAFFACHQSSLIAQYLYIFKQNHEAVTTFAKQVKAQLDSAGDDWASWVVELEEFETAKSGLDYHQMLRDAAKALHTSHQIDNGVPKTRGSFARYN